MPEKEVTKECARVPATGTPRSCPASTLLLASKPRPGHQAGLGGFRRWARGPGASLLPPSLTPSPDPHRLDSCR